MSLVEDMKNKILANMNSKKEEEKEDNPLESKTLDNDFDMSVARVAELKGDRNEADIPPYDEYWKASNKHKLAYAKGQYSK